MQALSGGMETHEMTGFEIIRDMSKEDMVNEIVEAYRESLSELDEQDLRKRVIFTRVQSYERRLINEADLTPPEEPQGGVGFIIGPN